MKPYQHPVTFHATGNLSQDYQFAFADYETNLTAHLPPDRNAKILDIGCGWGQFLSWVKEKGFSQLEGIDIGVDQAQHCQAIGLNAAQVPDPLSYLRDRVQTYDVVTMHHVIEHLPPANGLEMLKAIYNSLRPGGIAIIQTPNMSAISAGFSRFIEITHVTGFTESSLHEALLLAGFAQASIFGNRTPLRFTPRRLMWLSLQSCLRTLWRVALFSELGTDAPRILTKNLYAVACRDGAV
jgi:2-polyprenyl-3-methyl-5-hydroxy-6-metoxy-1,4-benzoquinol methylase